MEIVGGGANGRIRAVAQSMRIEDMARTCERRPRVVS